MIKHIFHISDIHNRLYKRHSEYRDVFRQLTKQIRDFNFEFTEALIVVTGDVTHSKTDMSPEGVDLTADLFTMLGELHKTIVIPGNHDMNLNNRNRLDSLSPIIDAMNHKNIIFLKESQVFEFDNVAFSAFSLVDDNHIPAKEIDDKFTKIALYHGIVSGTTSSFGYVFDDSHCDVKPNIFDGFDMVMLGDIHKPQKLSDNPEIWYPGSLIAQDFSEEYDHGFLLWDVEKKTAKFHEVKSDYGYHTVDIKDGITTSDVTKLSPISRVRFNLEDTTYEQYKEVLKDLRKSYNIREAYKLGERISNRQRASVSLVDVRNVKNQNDLIKEYLRDKYPKITDDELVEIYKINSLINKGVGFSKVRRGVLWNPKRFEFSNMFSYHEDNVIDFEKMNGVMGLFAPNFAGKTSILDSLLFCVFDKCSRTFKASNIMNIDKESFDCKFNFEIDGQDFWIHRKAKKQKGGNVRVEVDFWMIDDADEVVMLNADSRRSTNEIIRGYIGDYDDFVLTSLSSQINNISFIDKSQSEKKDLLAQFLDVGVFDDLYTYASEEVKEVKYTIGQYQKQDFSELQSKLEQQLTNSDAVISELHENKKECQEDEGKLIDMRAQKQSQITAGIPTDIVSELDIEEQIEEYTRSANEYDIEYLEFNKDLEKYRIEARELIQKRDKLPVKRIEENHATMLGLTQDWKETTVKLDRERTQIKICEDKLKIYENDDYNPECDSCNKREQRDRPEAVKIKNDLRNHKLREYDLVIDLDTLDGALDNFNDAEKEYNELKRVKVAIDELKLKVLATKHNQSELTIKIKDCNTEIEKLEKALGEYRNAKDSVEKNRQINLEIHEINSTLTRLKIELESINKEIQTEFVQKGIAENKLRVLKETIEKASQYESKFQAYKYYLEAVSRDGIQYSLISQIVPELESEINEILSQLAEFTISIELDGKDVNSYINKNGKQWLLDMTSGMERFICNLAFRTGLVNISNLPRPNFIAIDEGFGVMDPDNLPSVHKLFEYMRNHFDFVLIVSHIDAMKDSVDSIIDISSDGTRSKVQYE